MGGDCALGGAFQRTGVAAAGCIALGAVRQWLGKRSYSGVGSRVNNGGPVDRA